MMEIQQQIFQISVIQAKDSYQDEVQILIKYVKNHKVIKRVRLGWSMFNLIVIILKSSLVLSDKSNLIEHTWVRLIELGKLASV